MQKCECNKCDCLSWECECREIYLNEQLLNIINEYCRSKKLIPLNENEQTKN